MLQIYLRRMVSSNAKEVDLAIRARVEVRKANLLIGISSRSIPSACSSLIEPRTGNMFGNYVEL